MAKILRRAGEKPLLGGPDVCWEGWQVHSLCPSSRAQQAPAAPMPTRVPAHACPHTPEMEDVQGFWGGEGEGEAEIGGGGGSRLVSTDILYVSSTFTHIPGTQPKMKPHAQGHVSGCAEMQTRVS